MTTTKKLWIAIGVLIFLSPLGIIIPQWFGAGGAWGEWSLSEIENIAGFVPEGLKRIAGIWKAPLPDYSLPVGSKGLAVESIGYMLSAVVGIALIAGIMYIISKLLVRKNSAK
jgi:PDGLE domain-containing protein